MTAALDNLDARQQRVVRERVRSLLQQSPAFEKLDAVERKKVAGSLVDVVAYLADPKAGLAQAQAQAKGPGIVQEDFTAAAGREGAELFERLTAAVDFPDFVAELIDGVFNSIVDASIRQMEAYAKLLESVVKSVDEFAKDNFTPNQGRDWLAGRYPQTLRVAVDRDRPRLQLSPDADEDELAPIQEDLGLDQSIDLDDEDSELALAQRGQLEMARLRQKQLATMVLLGINRIVVTDGLINAKVLIDVRTSDVAQRVNRASSFDSAETRNARTSGGGWFSTGIERSTSGTRTVVTSAMDETSESKAEAKARLSGEVRVSFKSETFPLEKLASQTQLESMSEIARPDEKGRSA